MAKVIVPLVVATSSEGTQVYVYEGQEVPDNVPASEVKRLVDAGYVEKTK